jgi:hypothetical protein
MTARIAVRAASPSATSWRPILDGPLDRKRRTDGGRVRVAVERCDEPSAVFVLDRDAGDAEHGPRGYTNMRSVSALSELEPPCPARGAGPLGRSRRL